MKDFQTPDIIFQIGVAPRRIDIITEVSALDFDETLSQSVEVEIEGIKVHIPAIDDIIRNKKATGRTKDLADVEALESLKKRRAD